MMAPPTKSMDTMYDIVKTRLEGLIIDFEPVWIDRKMLDMAIEDLTSYLKFLWIDTLDHVKWLFDTGRVNEITDEEVFQDHFFAWLNSEPIQGRIEIHVWLSLWYGKWVERVKLCFREDDLPAAPKLDILVKKGTDILTLQEIVKYRKFAQYALIRYGEFVGTEVTADLIVKKEAGKLRVKPKTEEEQINFALRVMKEAAVVTTWLGPLITLKFKEGFFDIEERGKA